MRLQLRCTRTTIANFAEAWWVVGCLYRRSRAMNKANLKTALIGCGAIAREHLTSLSDLQNMVTVAAVCDLSPARAESTAERFGIGGWYTDYKKMLSEVTPDLVHITTPPSAHFELTKYCLDAGLNVLCEKPITLNYGQFVELKNIAKKAERILIENHNFRFHSSVRRITELVKSGTLGDVLDVQIFLALRIVDPGSAYIDPNMPHYGLALRGGVIGDFLTHIAYLVQMFAGPARNVHSIWRKHTEETPLVADEFRAIIDGERAPGYIAFSGNARPNGFWLRVTGTQMYAEANLYEPPRVILRRHRAGTVALMSMIDGLTEAKDLVHGSIAGLWRKLAGTSNYDGLTELLRQTYRAIELKQDPPISLDEMDQVERLVDSLTNQDLTL